MKKKLKHLRVTHWFSPNKTGTSTTMFVIGGFWLALMVFIWATGAASFIPSPLQVIHAFPRVWFERGLGTQLWTSMELNIEAVSIMFVLSYFISIATVMLFFRPLAVLVSSGRFNGFVGLPLIFASIFHNPHKVKIALLVFGMGVFTVLSLVKLFEGVAKDMFDHSRTLRMGEWRVVWEVLVLGTFDQVIDIMRINIAMGWMMLPMVEGRFKFEGGVGAMMEIDSKQFDYPAVFAVIAVILAVGLFQDYIIGLFKRIVCPYSELGLERAR